MGEFLLISDAAKEVQVESHVLRYWEEELHLPIKRNELGHRYYTRDDVERFKQIKGMKERGLQLKAIKMILRDGRLDVLPQEEGESGQMKQQSKKPEAYIGKSTQQRHLEQYVDREAAQSVQEPGPYTDGGPAIEIIGSRSLESQNSETGIVPESREEKSKRLQWLLQQLIRETLLENNQELCREIRESVVKELDYQFRAQEEREEERERRQEERGEAYYQKMDALLRSKSVFRGKPKSKKEKKPFRFDKEDKVTPITDKKKRHFLF
ncbi:MAG: helix-turn-helix domain-containing protein [Bacteroidales bacterium]|nr:helix-turn-helix domain-containing protein [Lachnoclostridium sp.]MCM1383825.1 helix-turn-helix domain-containing protein [Lachnoclostridium sp.]MCM1464521.1 helix-turn-helix domain-containing protein [Bacteroidales bacterium]